MEIANLLDEVLAPIAATPRGAAACAKLNEALADVVAAADEAKVDWAAQLTAMLPRLVKLSMGFGR